MKIKGYTSQKLNIIFNIRYKRDIYMHSIEEQLHSLLRELAPEVYTKEEQGKIIAQASSLYNSKFRNKRVAQNIDEKTRQGYMNDVILKAMAGLDEWDEYGDNENIIFAHGLSSKAVLHKIAQTKSKWGMAEILNPDVLKYLDFDEEDLESEQSLENGGNQTEEALKSPGIGRHRTDFQSNSSNIR